MAALIITSANASATHAAYARYSALGVLLESSVATTGLASRPIAPTASMAHSCLRQGWSPVRASAAPARIASAGNSGRM
ncbi:hypothetical protein D3C72_1635470 [compost metagenome]